MSIRTGLTDRNPRSECGGFHIKKMLQDAAFFLYSAGRGIVVLSDVADV